MNQAEREKQMAQAEELLGSALDRAGFAKGLYFGRWLGERLHPYPDLSRDGSTQTLAADLRRYCEEHIDPVQIDREALISDDVVRGLGKLGVLGACLPKEVGGLALTQTQYCRLLEVLGGHCASTALFVNAHHSIGPRSLVLFGTPAQQAKWLPKLASGEWISAFALTEPEAGSDAANVQTQATPTPDGRGYVLNGNKRWITNGGIAQVLTVMARTPVPGQKESKVTAFIVTPDMPGFEVVEKRMPKCGVRGSATARLAFHDMFVPKENILGQLGRGLKIALTVLDFGRTTFGASCTGAAKFCLARAVEHANTRRQFGQTLGSFELVKDKLAYMSAGAFAMESATYQTAALIDSGDEDYMLETAMLKVFATDVLWRIVNDTIQIFGGKAYFNDEPYERMMRDARINMIGEGANDVLRVFIALVGMRDVGLELQSVLQAIKNPLAGGGKLFEFTARKLGALLGSPTVVVRSTELQDDAARLGRLVGHFGSQVEALLRRHQEGILEKQYLLARVADAATELYVSSAVLNRLDLLVRDPHVDESGRLPALRTGRYYLLTAGRRIRRNLDDLWDNDDDATTRLADAELRNGPAYANKLMDRADENLLIVDARIAVVRDELLFTFTRSSGPGGQNVNKVNSKATLRWLPSASSSVPPDVLERFLVQYRSRLTTEGELLITSQRHRDQGRNIDDCLDKLREMLLAVAVAPKKRKPIKISRAAKRRRLDEKKKHGSKKQQRSSRFDAE